MTKNTSTSTFSRSRERRRLLQSSRLLYEGVGYSALNEDCSDDEQEIFNLEQVTSNRCKENIVERTLQPEDTLQSIALQYHVTIAELKRLNNIHRENEIHARKSLRIPIKPISSLVDLTPAPVHGERKSETRTVSIGSGCDPQEFLAAMDRDLARIRASVPTSQVNNPPSEILFTALEPTKTSSSTCSGSDWGLRWQQILVCSILLTFILPMLVWYGRHQEESQDYSQHSSQP